MWTNGWPPRPPAGSYRAYDIEPVETSTVAAATARGHDLVREGNIRSAAHGMARRTVRQGNVRLFERGTHFDRRSTRQAALREHTPHFVVGAAMVAVGLVNFMVLRDGVVHRLVGMGLMGLLTHVMVKTPPTRFDAELLAVRSQLVKAAWQTAGAPAGASGYDVAAAGGASAIGEPRAVRSCRGSATRPVLASDHHPSSEPKRFDGRVIDPRCHGRPAARIRSAPAPVGVPEGLTTGPTLRATPSYRERGHAERPSRGEPNGPLLTWGGSGRGRPGSPR